LGNAANRAYLTGVTTSLPLGCNGACTGATATYLDHVGSGLGGGGCPNLAFTGTDSIDALLGTVATDGFANNLILVGAGYVNNTNTPEYLGSQAWADNLDTTCTTQEASLTWSASHPYLPGDYILQGGVYWQMQKTTCTNTDASDIRCTSAATSPTCLTTPASPCTDGAAVWTETPNGGAHAPPLDYWCDSNTTEMMNQFDCYQLTLTGVASITNGTATVTVTNPPTFTVGQTVKITGASNGAYDCASGCTVKDSTATTVTYGGLAGSSADNLTGGTIAGQHSLNINTPNTTTTILSHQLPVPYEQPMRVWRKYLFAQIHAHYSQGGNPTLGYVRLGLTKSGETDTSNLIDWPYGSQNEMLSYEKEMYTFMGQNGCGTTFECVGNLHTYPTQEAAYMNANNIGFDNNALGVNQVTAIVAGKCLTAGALPNGGDWCLNFNQYNAPMPNGKPPVMTLQTGGLTQFSSPGSCGAGDVGAMSADPACTTAPFSTGYPGNLPVAYQYLANNIEMYFCDVMLALDSTYSTSTCKTKYSQTTYETPYQNALTSFLLPR